MCFKGKNRNVSLSGEAYFEVHKDARHPFIVRADEVEVKVLGTHFNLEAYPDDPEIKTTLLEGALAMLAALVLALPLESYLPFLPAGGNFIAYGLLVLLLMGTTV